MNPNTLPADIIDQVARNSGLEKLSDCCGVEGKFCTNDIWQGDLRCFVANIITTYEMRKAVQQSNEMDKLIGNITLSVTTHKQQGDPK